MAFRILLSDIKHMLGALERSIFYPFQNGGLCPVVVSEYNVPTKKSNFLKSFLDESILWAVPKHRRTIERRLKRKFGIPSAFLKMIIPKTDIMICNYCGHEYERRHLCNNCYTKAKKETKEMQVAIKNALGLDPVEQEVIVLYEGEKEGELSEFYEGKRIVEMKKERPAFFSRNLLQKSTVGPSDSTDVIPKNLG